MHNRPPGPARAGLTERDEMGNTTTGGAASGTDTENPVWIAGGSGATGVGCVG